MKMKQEIKEIIKKSKENATPANTNNPLIGVRTKDGTIHRVSSCACGNKIPQADTHCDDCRKAE